jgi:hypothetical protein
MCSSTPTPSALRSLAGCRCASVRPFDGSACAAPMRAYERGERCSTCSEVSLALADVTPCRLPSFENNFSACIQVVSIDVAAACHGPSNVTLVEPGPVALSDGPGDYADDMECVWNMTSSGPITVVFKTFAIEANHDFLRIFDSKSGDVLGNFSGEAPPAVLSTNATSLHVVFTSDSSTSSGGFELEAFALVPGGSWAPTGTPTALPTWAPTTTMPTGAL